MSVRDDNTETSSKLSDFNKNTKFNDTREGMNLRSWVWQYFDHMYIDNVRHAICKVEKVEGKKCGTKYRVNTSTSNCSAHLLSAHGITEDQVKNKNNIELINLPHNESRQLQLCHFLTNWIITDSQPFTVLENPAFRKFITGLDPKFQIPCIKYIKKLMHLAYNHSYKLIMEKVKNDSISISLTCDLWTSKNRQGYLGITCSYIDNEFRFHEITLSIEHIRYPHTAENISDSILPLLDELELRNKVFTITTDNGKNMQKAVKRLKQSAEKITWQPCAAHTLQLVIGKGLEPVKILIGRVKRLIDFFLRPKQSERLKNIQNRYTKSSENTKKTSTYLRHIIADVPTRWNSSYLAWCRLLELENYIRILEVDLANDSNLDSKKDSKYLTKIMLTKDEWVLLHNLIPLLGPFEEATRYLGGSNYVTYSIMNPIMIRIIDILKPVSISSEEINVESINDIFVELEICEKDDLHKKIDLDKPLQTSGVLEKVKETLYRAMHYYWKKDNTKSYLPSILDPRVKKFDFAPEKSKQIQELLRIKYNETRDSSITISTINTSSTSYFHNTTVSLFYKPTLLNIFNNPSPLNLQSELDDYLANSSRL
ncbi:5241_t:CDS:2 [Scutellospora calospora]|uniref:5241_t:CDS:1 n=1 Tax=Scutellospora calospora TaxID=85575 RepID=A0ACA9JTV6_9GLOM|nr:5241_t:CDS:2 [Scutellospora calospora]